MRVTNTGRMSNTSYHRRCNSAGQRYWWLRGPDGFVPLPQVRGDQDIDIEIDLAPGTYTLGCGPAGGHGRRERVIV